jgi:hypothetical protein
MSPSDADLGILLAVAAGWTIFVCRLFPDLKTPAAPRGIIDLQLAFTTERAATIVDDWRTHDRVRPARRSQCTDVVFIALYVTVLAIAAVLIAHATEAEHPHQAIVAALSAGALDLVEDVGLALQLRDADRQAQPVPLLTGLAAAAKLALLLLYVVLLIAEIFGY